MGIFDPRVAFEAGGGDQRQLVRLFGGHIECVDVGVFFLVFFGRGGAAAEFVAQPPVDMGGQFHALGAGLEHDAGAEARQRIDEGMDGAATLEVSGDDDVEPLEPAMLVPECKEIAQRLRRVLVTAVAAIDDGHFGIFGGEHGGAVARVADHKDIGVARRDAHGIGKRLALGRRAGGRIGAADRAAAEPQHRAFEGQPRARARFVEQRAQDRAGADLEAFGDPVLQLLRAELREIAARDVEDVLDLVVREVVDGGDVA